MGNTAKGILILMIVGLCCVAQQTHRRFLIAPKPQSSGGLPVVSGILANRWIATNLVSPVATWVDIVASVNWINNGANQPTWTNGFGVYFNGTTRLTNDNSVWSITTNNGTLGQCFFIVVRYDTLSGTYSGPIFAYNNTYMVFGSKRSQWMVNSSADLLMGTNATGSICDFCYAGNSNGTHYFYTNGILCLATNKGPAALGANIVGNYPPNGGLKGAIYEFVMWSNAPYFNATEAAAIHKYGTNAYGYAP